MLRNWIMWYVRMCQQLRILCFWENFELLFWRIFATRMIHPRQHRKNRFQKTSNECWWSLGLYVWEYILYIFNIFQTWNKNYHLYESHKWNNCRDRTISAPASLFQVGVNKKTFSYDKVKLQHNIIILVILNSQEFLYLRDKNKSNKNRVSRL